VDLAHTKRTKKQKKKNLWPVKVFLLTFVLAILFSLMSETTLLGVSLPVALLVLGFIIFLGILFDIIGIAVTCQDTTAYTAMASKRIRGAKQAIKLVQSAGMVSNICNDVVGDICSIVSGAMGAAISARLILKATLINELVAGIIISSFIAAFTVGGKAAGKKIAIHKSQQIVFTLGQIFAFFSKREAH